MALLCWLLLFISAFLVDSFSLSLVETCSRWDQKNHIQVLSRYYDFDKGLEAICSIGA